MIKKEQQKSLLDALAVGHTVTDACTIARVTREWFYNELKRSPSWKAEVELAALRCKERAMVRVQNAAVQPKHWTAAAWWLERKHPEEYAFTTKHELGESAGALADALRAALVGKARPGSRRKG